MSLRTLLLSGVLASGLTLTFVPRVAADPGPWTGGWGRSTRAAGGDDDTAQQYWWRRRGGRDYNRNGSPYYRNHWSYPGNDPRYSKLVDRINNDRAKISEIGPTGRHREALQWYRDDLRNAE